MIRALVVEDERVIREGIAEQVPWQDLQIDEVRTAENAESALALCATYHPGIIVSDIRMPGMDGIALCSKIRELLPQSEIIFISGYSDKAYLMSAIGLHAVSYIEKPISLDALTDALRAAVTELLKTAAEKANELHTLLDVRSGVKPTLRGAAFFMAVVRHRNCIPDAEHTELADYLAAAAAESGAEYAADVLGDRTMAVLFYSDDAQKIDTLRADVAFWKKLTAEQNISGGLFAGIGKIVPAPESVRQSYDDAADALNCRSYKGWGGYAFGGEPYGESPYVLTADIRADFSQTLADSRENHALDILAGIKNALVADHALLTYTVRSLYYTLDDDITKLMKQNRFDTDSGGDEDTDVKEHAETIQELHEYLCGRVQEALSGGDVQKSSFIVKLITDSVKAKYSDKNLSVQSLADDVYLTPTYISCLFKKKTGKTISQYIQEYRLEKAQQFLKDPQYKIYQISDMVGYDDAHYFAKLFRKQTGRTPSEFRDLP